MAAAGGLVPFGDSFSLALSGQRPPPGGDDRVEVVRREQSAHSILDGAQEPDADADPGLGGRVEIRLDAAGFLRTAE